MYENTEDYKQVTLGLATLTLIDAKKLYDIAGCRNAVDLFCGAGGLSHGLEMAGIKILLANDNFKQACTTYRNNHPGTLLIDGDINDENTRAKIFKSLNGKEIDLICGGPPCQGVSVEVEYLFDDPRNSLFKMFVEIVKSINPKYFLMENVEGLLTLNEGRTYNSIVQYFEEIGYDVKGYKLLAAEYGVPQKRNRVFIYGILKEINISPTQLLPERYFEEEDNQMRLLKKDRKKQRFVSVKEALSDLPKIDMDGGEEILRSRIEKLTSYQMLMKEIVDFEEFFKLRSLELES